MDYRSLLNVVLALALVSVVVVLFVGLFTMGRGGEFNRKYGNLMMRARIVSQGVAIVIVVSLFLLNR